MIRLSNILFTFLLIVTGPLSAQKRISLGSPDHKISFEFKLADGRPEYSVRFNKKMLIEHSVLSLSFENNDNWGAGLTVDRAVFANGEDDYLLPAGKTSKVHDFYKEVRIPLREAGGKKD